ncbi:FAD-binding domain-containing protein [Ichthyenterobacterium sp. W332]|uniref:FAD-binding domain-containing protein n=1 Tax=Microcosmobacter mediterraneus TaxID=3075607 RepID=A0ABU2YHF7_9FLAO|nr:FAD-binding domain-containing protein [Ichthyenterobacterium sp. W332]MDT0557602.1 FAD-binding domain-containing protein [Ichthyenterobacterium sp. W332]
MTKDKENIVVVWLKRDLRLHDNEAIYNALKTGKRVLLLYVFENLLLNDIHYSERHWNFVKESLRDINKSLEPYHSKVYCINSDITSAFNQLLQFYNIKEVYSHQETGVLVTYERDKQFARFSRNNLITWKESINNGVQRGLKNRKSWFDDWNTYMRQEQLPFKPAKDQLLTKDDINTLEKFSQASDLSTSIDSPFQKGGTTTGWRYADSFYKKRHKDYMFHISKPEASRHSCSRLSPYLAWGNLSVREVFQKGEDAKKYFNNKRHINAFLSRLRWQAHFIQKFEMEHIMEEASVNKGYHKLKKHISKKYQKAWREGKTGFPLVDASMRCLNTTGYLNFRMRALVVSFFTHILWQPWQDATHHLSQQFLDFEPGIHFPQLQMQAGETGINNLRIYNPIKNGIEHDPEASFIKHWLPELQRLETPFAHEPYLMTEMEQQFYDFTLGKDYPLPIVNQKINRKRASDILWNLKKNPTVIKESHRILKKHTLSDRTKMLKGE